MKAKKLVVFDFDGFFVDSFSILEITYKKLGYIPPIKEDFRKERGVRRYFGPKNSRLKNIIKMIRPKKISLQELGHVEYKTAKPYKPLAKFLQELINNPDVKVGFVSKNSAKFPLENIKNVLKNGNIKGNCDFIEVINPKKPKDQILKKIKEDFLEDGGIAIGLGDEINDYNAYKNTGFIPMIGNFGFDNITEIKPIKTQEELIKKVKEMI